MRSHKVSIQQWFQVVFRVPVASSPPMNSAMERHRITIREKRPALLPQRGEPVCRLEAMNGARRNQVAVSGLRVRGVQERDYWDMSRLAQGDEEALNSLMQRHSKSLFVDLQRIVKNRADAEELVQEAFIRVFRHRLRFNFESRFSSWLYTIGLNLARTLLRWRARQPESVPIEDSGELADSVIAETLTDPAPTPDEQTASDEWTDALEEALARLPKQLEVPLRLVALDGCSQAEVAARLGCSVKAVETRLYHGRKRLRLELEQRLNPWRCRVKGAIRPPGAE